MITLNTEEVSSLLFLVPRGTYFGNLQVIIAK
jgi:hypothetical protein